MKIAFNWIETLS